MQALTLTLLLVLAAPAEEAATDRRHRPMVELLEPRAPSLPPPTADPCAVAREIVRQRPCLADGECDALELWRRSFGSPRFEPLGPGRAADSPRPAGRAGAGRFQPWSPSPRRPLRPGTVCPAKPSPPR